MPWWAVTYLFAFLILSVAGDAVGLRDSSRRWAWMLDAINGLVVAVLFAAFWLEPIANALGLAAPVLFVLVAGWEIYSTPKDIRDIWADADLTPTERMALIVVGVLVMWPAYVFAGLGAFRQL